MKTSDYPTLTPADVTFTELGDWHTSTEPRVVAILAALPDYVTARRAVLALRDLKQAAAPPKIRPAVDTLHDRVVAKLRAGEPIPSNLLDMVPDIGCVPVREGRNLDLGVHVAANATEVLLARAQAEATDRAQKTIRAELDGILAGNHTRILKEISKQLVELVTSARKVLTGPGRIPDADTAIETGRVEEWKHSAGLEHEYVELRRLQMYWSSRTGMVRLNGSGDQFAAFVSNPLEVCPDLSRIVLGRPYADAADEAAYRKDGPKRAPWPSSWTDADGLWWFATHHDAVPIAATEHDWEQMQSTLSAAHVAHRKGARRPTSDQTVAAPPRPMVRETETSFA